MVNVSGTLNTFRALVQPRLLVPSLTVKCELYPDIGMLHRPLTKTPLKAIRGINFEALRKAGYVGAVFDKDNCLVGVGLEMMEGRGVAYIFGCSDPSVR